MAQVSSECLYYQNAILKNAFFFAGPKVNVDIVEEVQPSGTWRVHVVKIEAGRRSSVLSETAPDVQEALRKLHVKSAQAVHEHVRTNDFDFPPVVSSMSRGGVGDELSASEVIAICNSSSDNEEEEEEEEEEVASESDDSLDRRTTNRRGREQRRSRRVAVKAVSRMSLRSDDDLDFDDDENAHMSDVVRDRLPYRPLRRVPLGAARPSYLSPPRRSDDGGWGGFYTSPPSVRPPPPPGPPIVPPPRPFNSNTMAPREGTPREVAPPQRCVPAMLNINWMGRGRKNLLAQVAPTESALTHLAVTEARMRPGGFSNANAPPPYPSTSPVSLRAVIRRVSIGGDTYEVTGFGNDLSALFSGSPEIPRFDIEIIDVLMPALVRPRTSSVSSMNSDNAGS